MRPDVRTYEEVVVNYPSKIHNLLPQSYATIPPFSNGYLGSTHMKKQNEVLHTVGFKLTD